ncbi:MAG: putative nucleic-acid-binding protein implicated in transcription termination [Candidatus Carbobacillus altaicus]|uniref:Putative nucleic-acid-binding protein implicated in transcription termination n=1 Tax=Candidatus Carbonibacillus altaicus TaxID=2163959 RepID=A0A2R6Y032_9BACL|nr:MAG: putative nucleic-acid-binding protein implicated in transcription termination [Candidatus Carbobacillus altaicus]
MAGKTKKIPIRRCIACGAQKPKKELVRIVRTPEGALLVDRKGKVSGRGAYLCPSEACLKLALKKKLIERALEVPLTPEFVEVLETQWADMLEEAPSDAR